MVRKAAKKKKAGDMRVVKTYNFCKSLVYAIQAITGKSTHDILGVLVEKGDALVKANEVAVDERIKSRSWWNPAKTYKDYMYYPGTELYLGVYMNISTEGEYANGEKEYYNSVRYSFKLPSSVVKMTEEEYNNIVIDGMLADASFNFDPPKLKPTVTPAEKRAKKEAQELKRKEKAAAKLTKKKSKIP